MLNSRAEEYRRLARDCLQLGTTFVTEEARSILIEMARVWSRLADEQDKTRAPMVIPEGSEVVVQQQQQHQAPSDKGDDTE
jgi:hypothetical protein